MAEWIADLQSNGDWFAWLGVLAGASWLLTLVALPAFVARIPEDYFHHDHRRPLYADSRHPVVGWTLVLLKNIFGAALVVLGLIMLFTPGQGLLTVLIGLMLLNFPGKYHAERWLVSRPGVLKALNWLRARAGKQPVMHP